MNHTTRRKIEEAADKRRRGIADEKGAEYSGEGANYKTHSDADVLRNFKVNGSRLGTSPLLTAGLYFGKHCDSVFTFLRQQETMSMEDRKKLANAGEGIVSRLDDIRNYCDLIECLLRDAELVVDQGEMEQQFIREVVKESMSPLADWAKFVKPEVRSDHGTSHSTLTATPLLHIGRTGGIA